MIQRLQIVFEPTAVRLVVDGFGEQAVIDGARVDRLGDSGKTSKLAEGLGANLLDRLAGDGKCEELEAEEWKEISDGFTPRPAPPVTAGPYRPGLE